MTDLLAALHEQTGASLCTDVFADDVRIASFEVRNVPLEEAIRKIAMLFKRVPQSLPVGTVLRTPNRRVRAQSEAFLLDRQGAAARQPSVPDVRVSGGEKPFVTLAVNIREAQGEAIAAALEKISGVAVALPPETRRMRSTILMKKATPLDVALAMAALINATPTVEIDWSKAQKEQEERESEGPGAARERRKLQSLKLRAELEGALSDEQLQDLRSGKSVKVTVANLTGPAGRAAQDYIRQNVGGFNDSIMGPLDRTQPIDLFLHVSPFQTIGLMGRLENGGLVVF